MGTIPKTQRNDKNAGAEAPEIQNPLLNDAVLLNLFEVIPFNLEEFKKFRLVCKQWNKRANRRFRRNAWIHLYGSSDLVFNEDHHPRVNSRPAELEWIRNDSQILRQFLDCNVAFEKYEIHTFMPESLLGDTFWLQIGPTITHLKLSLDSEKLNVNDVRQVIFDKIPNLMYLFLKSYNFNILSNSSTKGNKDWEWEKEFAPPILRINKNLRELTIDHTGDAKKFPLSWKEFIGYYPNIKVLNLHLCNWDYELSYRWLRNFLEILISARERCGQHLMQLDSLNIMNINRIGFPIIPPSLEMIALLHKVVFPLTKLTLEVEWGRHADVVFKDILKIYAPTLQKLTVCRLYSTYLFPCEDTFTRGLDLKKLTELTLVGNICKDLYFLADLPNLKKLVTVDYWAMTKIEAERSVMRWCKLSSLRGPPDSRLRVIEQTNFSGREMIGVVLSNMETAILGPEVCNQVCVKSLAKLMPHLKTLQLGMTIDGFHTLCKEWNHLQHLTIDPMDLQELDLLGVKNEMKYCVPNITDLKDLKTFSVGPTSSNRGGPRANLTSDSITYGILALENLQDAFIGVEPDVSDELKSTLASRFPGMRTEPRRTSESAFD
ncbi:unnamed protein product [Orchesella dallaii]|uniref:F-box domain-containing protein n=1 Tax=Orchesella dallaii TaxID=48710 RepID=A0ABP1RU51_9HEXA